MSPTRLQAADSQFLYTTCQVGAEAAIKAEVARDWPALSFAFSRPGFLTFKLPPAHGLPEDFDLRSVFARASGFSLGKVTVSDPASAAAEVWRLVERHSIDAMHVWPRDRVAMGFRGFEPGLTPESEAVEAALRAAAPMQHAMQLPRVAQGGQLVLDCILIEPDLWWVGYHRARDGDSCYPGGLRALALPEHAVSRAYLKMQEAIEFAGLPLQAGQTIVEIGCAPGGASQALLDRGLKVIGIDPAKVDPRVLANPNFRHIQKRGADVRRREFRRVSWLAADMNVAPQFTLDTVEAIVTHPEVNIRGLLLTLKLLDWKLAAQVPEYLKRVRSFGYRHVAARQLAHNRREVCVAAMRRKR